MTRRLRTCFECGYVGMWYSEAKLRCPKCHRVVTVHPSGSVTKAQQAWWDAEHPQREVPKPIVPSMKKCVAQLEKQYRSERKKALREA